MSQLLNLEAVDLGENNLANAEDLKNNTNLRGLYLYNNKIETCQGIRHLKNLTTLNLNNNLINNADHLSDLSGLRHLYLSGNHLKRCVIFDGFVQFTDTWTVGKSSRRH